MGQSTIVFDDFYGWIPFSLLLRLLDRNPLNLNQKGTTSPCLATRFFFTSNAAPSMWYRNVAYDALDRRLTIIDVKDPIEFEEDATTVDPLEMTHPMFM